MENPEQRAARYQLERESRERRLVYLLGRVGSELVSADRASLFEVRQEKEGDVYLSLRSTLSPEKIFQVQAGPSKFDASSSTVTLREINYQELMKARASGGNENEAVTRVIINKRQLPNLVDSFGQLLRDQLPLSNSPKKAA